MTRIAWSVFFDNTSTAEELIDFANGGSIAHFYASCWPDTCKHEIRKMRHLGVRRSQCLARRALQRRFNGSCQTNF